MPNLTLSQMHIEAARNATDDFNLFHDKHRWHWLKGNPFGGPIALGFQQACIVEDQVKRHRLENPDQASKAQRLNFSVYELTFAGVVRSGDELGVQMRPAKFAQTGSSATLSNRLALKANGKTVMLGYKRDSSAPLAFAKHDPLPLAQIKGTADRSFIQNTPYFLKRKYMIVGNAKNFLTSAFAEQSEYIDEFVDKVSFPETYPLGLISSALLERAQALDHDLIDAPMIYTSHKLCIDKTRLGRLKSGDALNILVKTQEDLGDGAIGHYCAGVLADSSLLYEAYLQLAPLSKLTKG